MIIYNENNDAVNCGVASRLMSFATTVPNELQIDLGIPLCGPPTGNARYRLLRNTQFHDTCVSASFRRSLKSIVIHFCHFMHFTAHSHETRNATQEM